MKMMMKHQLMGLWRCGCGVRTLASKVQHQRDKPPFNILFLGTDSFALETLKALHLNRLGGGEGRVVDTLHVVSTSTKSPVANFAQTQDLTLLTWPPELRDLDLYDLGVLVSFGRMVRRKVIAKFPHGILNVHPALLPRWRGASPIMHTVLNADSETGVSVMAILPSHFDRGPIVQQKKLPLAEGCSADTLASVLAQQGARLLIDTLKAMPQILHDAKPQSDSGVTYAHKATATMSEVNWKEHTVSQIKQQYLALSHMFPLRSSWNQQSVKLLDMVLDTDTAFVPSSTPGSQTVPASLSCQERVEEDCEVAAGTVVFDPKVQALCVRCANGWVAFRSVVLRKTMSAADFHNGYLSKDKHSDVRFSSHHNGLFDQQYWNFVHQPKGKRS